MQGVFEGFGGNFASFGYDTPNYAKLANLERNVYAFSGAKNWNMLRELTDAVKDTNNFKDFLEKATGINRDYNINWRKAEYVTAVNGSANAAKWVEFNKRPAAMLEFRVADVETTCPICGGFNNMRRPVNDPVWKEAAPPLHFRCGCQVQETNDDDPTPDHLMPSIEPIPPMFRTNLAERGLIFPPGSAFYINTPPAILKGTLDLLPYERRFETLHEGNNGGYVIRHIDVDTKNAKNNPYDLHLEIAKEKADKGHRVELLPAIDNTGDPRRIIFKNAKEGKNPDLRIDGSYVEVKAPKKMNRETIKGRISDGFKQADHVIINLTQDFDDKDLAAMAKGEIGKHKERIVEFRHKGKYTLVDYKKNGGSE